MCGRYALTSPPDVIRELLGYIEQPNFPPRYNIAPTQPVPVVISSGAGERRFVLMRWGFLPDWLKDPKDFPLVFNIRSESAAEKPAFKNALRRRRGVMPADGFYEWRKIGKDGYPYLIRRRDRRAFGFAALWETFSAPDGSEIDTAAILTTAAPAALANIHPRSPIILDERDHARWLDPETPIENVRACLQPPQVDLFEAIGIGPGVNKVANDDPSIQESIPSDAIPEPAPTRPRRASQSTGKDRPDDGDQGSLF